MGEMTWTTSDSARSNSVDRHEIIIFIIYFFLNNSIIQLNTMTFYISGSVLRNDSLSVGKESSLLLRSVYLQSAQNSGRGLATGLGAIW